MSGVNWQGAAKVQTDPRFVTFISAEMGVRALVRTLLTYFKQHQIRTVRGVINRWAPPSENNTGAYISAVLREMSRAKGYPVSADETLDLDVWSTMRPLVVAIIAHENAGYAYPASVIDAGLRLGGIADARPRSLLSSGEVHGAIASTPLIAVSAASLIETFSKARDQLLPVAGISPLIQMLLVTLSVAGCIAVIWSRFSSQQKTLS